MHSLDLVYSGNRQKSRYGIGISHIYTACFSQFDFGMYCPICRIRLHFHHMFWSYKDNQCSGRGIYRIKIWDYSHSESGRSPTEAVSSKVFSHCFVLLFEFTDWVVGFLPLPLLISLSTFPLFSSMRLHYCTCSTWNEKKVGRLVREKRSQDYRQWAGKLCRTSQVQWDGQYKPYWIFSFISVVCLFSCGVFFIIFFFPTHLPHSTSHQNKTTQRRKEQKKTRNTTTHNQ